jgi:hypothetical protein
VDLLYLGTKPERMTEAARRLASQGLLRLQDGDQRASATDALLAHSERIEAEMRQAQQELEKKHAFERG